MSEEAALLSIADAAAKGIGLLRSQKWTNPLSHLRIDILDGKPGPWVHLYDPMNVAINKKDPVDILFLSMDYNSKDWLEYTGPVSGSAEYDAALESMIVPYPA
jgi:hypothetical protein